MEKQESEKPLSNFPTATTTTKYPQLWDTDSRGKSTLASASCFFHADMIAALSSCSLRFCSSESPDLPEPVCGGPSRSTTSVSSGIYLLSLGQYHYKENRTQVRNLRGEVRNNFLLQLVPLGTEQCYQSAATAEATVVVPAEEKSRTTFYFDLSGL